MTHEWEQPVTTVLDYFYLDDVTLIGVSMGGYLVLRAAAFEERISRVVAFDIFIFDQHGSGLQGAIYRLFLRYPGLYNWVAQTAMKRSVAADHVVNQWMYITGVDSPAEWNALIEYYSVSDIAHLVIQDVLLLAGEKDHMIPIKEYQKNWDGLVNARSVSGRIFTAEEQAHNHCQMGNFQLALDEMLAWIDEKS
jgi:pimeloyl-ACP methyl ester carboxylesterase